MSDSPSSPGSPFIPGSPCDPLNPGGPGGPTHTHVNAYSMNYCDDSISKELFKNQKTTSI